MYFTENFRKHFYTYNIHIYLVKSPLASTIASIWDQNLGQVRMTISLSMLVIASEILALERGLDFMRLFIDLSL